MHDFWPFGDDADATNPNSSLALLRIMLVPSIHTYVVLELFSFGWNRSRSSSTMDPRILFRFVVFDSITFDTNQPRIIPFPTLFTNMSDASHIIPLLEADLPPDFDAAFQQWIEDLFENSVSPLLYQICRVELS